MALRLVVYYTALPVLRPISLFVTLIQHPRDLHTPQQEFSHNTRALCLPILIVSIRYPTQWYMPLIPFLATLQAQHQSQGADQTSVPMAAAPSSPKSLSNQSNVAAQDRKDTIEPLSSVTNASTREAKDDATVRVDSIGDPLDLGRHRRENISQKQMKADHPLAKPRHMKKFYTRQNALIDQFLQSGDEERLAALDHLENGPKVRFAVNASFVVNFCLFIIQMYAAISTGSLSLFATAADAFMDLVSSCVMLATSRMAARPSVYKYPVGRTRIETIGIIMFCCLMTTVAIQLIVNIPPDLSWCWLTRIQIESGRALGAGAKESEALHLIPIIFVSVASK